MSAKRSRTAILLLLTASVGAGCTSTGSSSGTHWPWTKSKPAASDDKKRDADVLGTPPAPRQAKAGANKPAYGANSDAPASVTLRTPRVLDDRELDRAAR